MGSGIYFPLSALLFSFLLVGLTFFKKHIKIVETKLYSLLVLSNSLGLFVELLCTYASYIYDKNVVLANFILKLYLQILIQNHKQILSLDNEKIDLKKSKIWSILIFAILNVIIFILPIKLVVENNFTIRYTTGLSVYFTYFIITYCLSNIYKLSSKIPVPSATQVRGDSAIKTGTFNS